MHESERLVEQWQRSGKVFRIYIERYPSLKNGVLLWHCRKIPLVAWTGLNGYSGPHREGLKHQTVSVG